jgi:hypothetical protein
MNNPNISKTSGFTKFTRILLFIYILSGIGLLIYGQHLKNTPNNASNNASNNGSKKLDKGFGQILMYVGIGMIILNIISFGLTFIIPTIIDVLVILQFIGYIIGLIKLIV